MITLDTTRADRIRAYGYRDIDTSAIDRLAREVNLGRALEARQRK